MPAMAAAAKQMLMQIGVTDLKIERELLGLFAATADELKHPWLLCRDVPALPARDLGAPQHIQVLCWCIMSQTS